MNQYVPKINLMNDIAGTKLSTDGEPFRMGAIANGAPPMEFKDIFTGMMKNLNDTVKAPDQVLQDAVLEQGADIHDVMIAISKAELGVNYATSITTKVIQSYEKVMSIQL